MLDPAHSAQGSAAAATEWPEFSSSPICWVRTLVYYRHIGILEPLCIFIFIFRTFYPSQNTIIDLRQKSAMKCKVCLRERI